MDQQKQRLPFRFNSIPTSSNLPPSPHHRTITTSPHHHPQLLSNIPHQQHQRQRQRRQRQPQPQRHLTRQPSCKDDRHQSTHHHIRSSSSSASCITAPIPSPFLIHPTPQSIESKLPDQIIQTILEFLPDKFGFKPTLRSRKSSYGFEHTNVFNVHPTSSSSSSFDHSDLNESEGLHWPTPPMAIRLLNKRWARVAAQVFLSHLSINSVTRLESSVRLFSSFDSILPRFVRSMVISIKSDQVSMDDRSIRDLLSKLLNRLTALRSLSIRGLPPGILFPAPLEIHQLFLPPSIIRLAIEFRSQEDSALLSSVVDHQSSLSPQSHSSLPPRSSVPTRPSTTPSSTHLAPIELHAAELNLLLACLPHLRSLHLSRFRSQSHRPLSRYLTSARSIAPPSNPAYDLSQQYHDHRPHTASSLRSLILTDCELSEADAQFISSRFIGLQSLWISNHFIDSQHISAINTLISTTSSSSSPTIRSSSDPPLGYLADDLEHLTIRLVDFTFDSATLIDSSTSINRLSHHAYPDSKPSATRSYHNLPSYSSTSVSSSLSAQYDSIDLSPLEKLKFLSIFTPTRVQFGHRQLGRSRFRSKRASNSYHYDDDRSEESLLFHNNCLSSLEIDARLIFNVHDLSHHRLTTRKQDRPDRFNLLECFGRMMISDRLDDLKLKNLKVLGDGFISTDVRNYDYQEDYGMINNPTFGQIERSIFPSMLKNQADQDYQNEAHLNSQEDQEVSKTNLVDDPCSIDLLLRSSFSSKLNPPTIPPPLLHHYHHHHHHSLLSVQKLKLQFFCWSLNILWSS